MLTMVHGNHGACPGRRDAPNASARCASNKQRQACYPVCKHARPPDYDCATAAEAPGGGECWMAGLHTNAWPDDERAVAQKWAAFGPAPPPRPPRLGG